MTTRRSVSLVAALLLAGCSPPPEARGPGQIDPTGAQPDPSDDTGVVTFQLTTVPTGVQCIRINAITNYGTMTTTKTFAVTSGSSSAGIAFGTVQAGPASFTGDAFDVACASIGTASPTWGSDTPSATIRPGVATTVPLTFRRNYSVTTSVNFAHTVKSVVAGYSTTYITTEVGPYWWGSMPYTKTPTAVPVLTDAQKVVGGNAHSCALRNDGTVWCWGDSSVGQLGPGVAMGSSSANPVQVTGLSNVTQLAAGDWHTCAWPQPSGFGSGLLYCWGGNSQGQLGNGTTTNSSTPVAVGSFYATYRSMAAGSAHTLAVTSGGGIVAWGGNGFGQLGLGTTTATSPLSWVTGNISAVVAVTAGSNHSCALHADGTVHCWGNNNVGQVGDGTTTMRTSPAWVTSLPGAVRQLASGGVSNCGVLADGRITCWGDDSNGQLGNNSTTNSPYPVINGMPADTGMSVTMGNWHGCALTSGLDVYCWGGNGTSQLGDGSILNAFSPVKVILP